MFVSHHHRGVSTVQIPLTFSLSKSVIALGKSPKRHPLSTQSWLLQAFAGQPILVSSWVVVYRRMSFMSNFTYTIIIQQKQHMIEIFLQEQLSQVQFITKL